MKKRVLLAVSDENYSVILRNALKNHTDLFEVSSKEVFHRRYLEEMADIEKPDILIVHDYFLESDLQEPKEKEKEILDLIKKFRSNYDDSLRIVYLCERQKGDPFLSSLVGIGGVLDIFNQNAIDLDELVEQLSEKPRFSKVEKLLVPTSFEIPMESEKEEEEDFEEEPTEEVEEHPKSEKPIIQKVIEKKIVNKVIEKKIINKNVIKRDYKIHIHNQVEKIVGVNIQRKLILVGSPFKRTGSTFFSLLLAKTIQNQGIGVTYIENPYAPAYCYDRFYGNKNASDYVSLFYAHTQKELDTADNSTLFNSLSLGIAGNSSYVWNHEDVRLVALNPTKEKIYTEEDINLEVFIKILLSLQDTPYIIVDVGSDWKKEIFKELYQLADYAYLTLEPDIPNIERLKLGEDPYFLSVREMMEHEKTFVIGNRFTKQINNKIFDYELEVIPEFPSEHIFQSQFDGTFLPKSKESLKLYEQTFTKLTKKILPNDYLKYLKHEKSLLKGLFNKKIKIEPEVSEEI